MIFHVSYHWQAWVYGWTLRLHSKQCDFMQASFQAFSSILILEVHLDTYCNTKFINSFSTCFNCFFWSWEAKPSIFVMSWNFTSLEQLYLGHVVCLRRASTVVTDDVCKARLRLYVQNSMVNTTDLVGHWVAFIPSEALAKAIPAIVDAYAFFTCFWVGCLTDLSNHSKTSLIAFEAQ